LETGSRQDKIVLFGCQFCSRHQQNSFVLSTLAVSNRHNMTVYVEIVEANCYLRKYRRYDKICKCTTCAQKLMGIGYAAVK